MRMALVLIMTAVIIVGLANLVQAPTMSEWPMFRHDLNHTGYSTSTAPNTNQIAWSYTIGDWVFSSPAVAGGMVYVGSYDFNVYCLDAATGAFVWSYTTGHIVWSSPAVAGGMVYVGSIDYYVYCLDAATGAYVWSYRTNYGVWSSPAVAGGMVYVGSGDGNVYCLDAATGAFVWSYTTGSSVTSSPAVAGGMVYVGSLGGNVYCLDAATGAYVWSYTTGSGVWSSPAVAGGMVYVGSDDYNVYCLDAATGAYVWSYTTGSGVESSPAVAGGMVYVGSGDGKVYCLDAATGAYVWSYTIGMGVFSSPAVAGGMVYVGSLGGNVYCLDAATGAYVWSYTTGSSVFSSPAVAGGMVYVGSYDGKVYAFGPTMLQLTVVSAYDSPSPTSGVFTYGTSITASVTSPVAGPAGTQYVCTGWTGTGDVPASGTGTTLTFTITQNSSITWNWKTQYYITVTSAHDSPTASDWVDAGTDFTASVSSPDIVSAGHQFVCTGYEIDGGSLTSGISYTFTSVAANHTIVFEWQEQYYLTVTTNPSGVNSPTDEGWYDAGSSASVSTDEYVGIVFGSSRYRFNDWTTTNMSEIADPTLTSTTVLMDQAKTVTANYMTQYNVTFAQSGVGSYFRRTVVVVDGTGYSLAHLPVSFWFDNGSRHSFAYKSPLVATVNGKRYAWSSTSGLSTGQSGSIVVSGSGSVTGNYKTQYHLTMRVIPYKAGTTSPGSGWYDAGSVLSISVTAKRRYVFQWWLGIGSGSYTGFKNTGSITMNSPITEIAVMISPRH